MSNQEAQQKLALRVKSKKSQNAVLRDVDVKETVQTLLVKLSGLTEVPENKIAILKGFPPKRISYNSNASIESLGLQNQDTIIVELDTTGTPNKGEDIASKGSEGSSLPNSEQMRAPETTENTQVPVGSPPNITVNSDNGPSYADLLPSGEEDAGLLLRQIVPSDNSCLFTSVTFCLSGDMPTDSEGGSSFLREMIANTVASNKDEYNEAILGRPNKDYVSWIKKPESWGGGIELSILADFYGLQISVVDIQSSSVAKFGEDKNFQQQMILIYDGIHYDPLYYEPLTGGASRTIFETADTKMVERALQLAAEAKASNQYTDLKNFALRCQVCNALIKGEEEAQAHAKKTGHAQFNEIQKK